MDLTSLMSSLLSDQNIKAVASKAGVSEEEAASVLATALPVMLNGANGQASDAATTESFYKAVTDHAQKDPEKVDLKDFEATEAVFKKYPNINGIIHFAASKDSGSSGTADYEHARQLHQQFSQLFRYGISAQFPSRRRDEQLIERQPDDFCPHKRSCQFSQRRKQFQQQLARVSARQCPGLRQHRQQLQALLLRKPPRLPSGRHGRHAAAELFWYAGFSAGRFFQSAVLRA